MSVYNEKFRKARRDYSPYLFHFVNGRDADPKATMYKILEEQRLISEKGYICFSASPLTSIGRFFDVNVNSTGAPLYHPYGIGFFRDILVRDFGARNVIYYDDNERDVIPRSLTWRSLRLNVDSYDYEYLREWRINGHEFSFADFPSEHMIIVAPNIKMLNDLTIVHDVEYKPIVDYANGDVEPDWDEVFKRAWKGITVGEASELIDDFAVSGSTATQVLGEDMCDQLFGSFPFYLGSKNH